MDTVMSPRKPGSLGEAFKGLKDWVVLFNNTLSPACDSVISMPMAEKKIEQKIVESG